MAVITAGGIVGKVLRVYPSTALVLMINDQSSGVGAMLEKSRLQGVLRGTPEGDVILERVMSDEQVAPGETVISSGGDQIFPKGLPVGTVTSVKPGHEMFLSIHIKPSADLNRLEEVLVVTEKQEQNPVAEGAGRVRAADILASRLPSVPDKLVAPAAVPASGPAGGVSPPAANPAPGGKVSAAAIPPPTVRKPLAQAVSGRGALPVQANSQPPSAVNAANRNPTLNAATANQVSQSANAAAKKAPVKLTAVPAPANPISTTGSGNTPQATLAFAPNKPKAQPPKPPADPSTAAADTPH
jgi:rod shape-determining protein MreC